MTSSGHQAFIAPLVPGPHTSGTSPTGLMIAGPLGGVGWREGGATEEDRETEQSAGRAVGRPVLPGVRLTERENQPGTLPVTLSFSPLFSYLLTTLHCCQGGLLLLLVGFRVCTVPCSLQTTYPPTRFLHEQAGSAGRSVVVRPSTQGNRLTHSHSHSHSVSFLTWWRWS